jgi:hypothetical protein
MLDGSKLIQRNPHWGSDLSTSKPRVLRHHLSAKKQGDILGHCPGVLRMPDESQRPPHSAAAVSTMAPRQIAARIEANLSASVPQLRHSCRFALPTKLEQRILS